MDILNLIRFDKASKKILLDIINKILSDKFEKALKNGNLKEAEECQNLQFYILGLLPPEYYL